mmetsp:Transcript_13652/g.11404  ORF Transcript_13652/g.11404 Transcript_13652/m.11404 type:complete len:97 (+) Transcript_13652:562-852(+)
MENGKKCMELTGHTDYITSSLFSPKNDIILTTSKDTTAILWNFESGNQIFQLVGHKLAINCSIFSQDGNQCYTGSSDLTCRYWCTNTGICLGIMKD